MKAIFVALVCLAATAMTAAAQEGKKESGDATQGIGSPIQVGSGVTFLISQETKSLTAGLSGQSFGTGSINFWQVAFTGTTNDEGESLIYSTSDTAAPGFKAKAGFGYSSFLAADTRTHEQQAGAFLTEAWCFDLLESVNRALSKPVARGQTKRCAEYFETVRSAAKASPPVSEAKTKMVEAVLAALSPVIKNLSLESRGKLCVGFKDAAPDAFKLCFESGEKQKTAEEQRRQYPDLYTAMVTTLLPKFYYVVSGNYQPTLASTPFRAKVDGVFDLETKHTWTKALHGGSLDTALYYGRLAAGVQLAYTQTAEIKLSSVCKITTSGDFRSETCKDAMLGEPTPDKAFVLNTVLQLDPLVMPKTSTILRPGGQFELRYQRPQAGTGNKVEIALPFFLAPVSAPFKMVIGLRPTWVKDTTGDDPDRHFSVFFFIGARPGIGG